MDILTNKFLDILIYIGDNIDKNILIKCTKIYKKEQEKYNIERGIIPIFGKIRIRNTPSRGVVGSGYPNVTGWTNIPAWSRGASPWKQLSPFVIGPVNYIENGIQRKCDNFENFWQSHKVWHIIDKQTKPEWRWKSETHINGQFNRNTPLSLIPEPNDAWYIWHDALLANDKAVRRPNGKIAPLYAWWQGKKLGIIESRKQIYIPYLQALYRNHPVYQRIYNMVRRGTNIILLEPDGPTFELYPQGMDVTYDIVSNLQNVTKMEDFPGGELYPNPNKYIPYGHGYVISLTIFEDLINNKQY
jgi:hypothetical protein